MTRPPFDPGADFGPDDQEQPNLGGMFAPIIYSETGQRLAAQPARGEQLRTVTAPIVHLAAALGVVVGMLGMVLVVVIIKVVGA